MGEMSDSESSDSSNEELSPETDLIIEQPTHHPLFDNITLERQEISQPSIHILTDDCIYLIFEYLDIIETMRLATVCRRWYNLCINKMSLVSKIELNPTFSIFRLNRSLSQSNFISLLGLTGQNLIQLDVSSSSLRLDWASCKAISQLCPKLEELNLSKMKINNKLATCFSQFLPPNLKSLILNGCVHFKEKCLEHILRNTKELTKLDLSYDHKVTGSCITKQLERNKMTHFNFTECYRLKPSVVQFVLANFEDTLEHLDLSLCPGKVFNISTNQLPVLKRLKVFNVKSLVDDNQPTSETMTNFIRLMPNLEVLDLENNYNIDMDKFIGTLTQLCSNIRYLNLSCCMPKTAHSLASLSLLQNLDTLHLNELPKRFDYKELVDSTLINCTNLKNISLQASCVDDASVFSLIAGLKKLQILDLRSCILPLDGTFILLCQDLDRQDPLKILAQDTVMQEDEFPLIPVFLDINFGLPNFQDDYDGFFGGPYDEFEDGFGFDDIDYLDEDDFWGGAYVDEAGQFAGAGFDYHPDYQEVDEDEGWW